MVKLVKEPKVAIDHAVASLQQRGWRGVLFREWLGICLLLLCALPVLHFVQLFGPLDRLIYDGLLSVHRNSPDSRIFIVAIDDKRVTPTGPVTWSSETQTQLLETLKSYGPKAIAFDVPTDIGLSANKAENTVIDAKSESVPVFLAVEAYPGNGTGKPDNIVEPRPNASTTNTTQFGYAGITPDTDGFVRSTHLRVKQSDAWRVHLMWEMASVGSSTVASPPGEKRPEQATPSTANSPAGQLQQADLKVYFPFSGASQSFTTFTYADILAGRVSPQQFKNKYVLVGMTAKGLVDRYPVPVANIERLMPSVEINANLLDALLNKNTITRMNIWVANALALAILVIVMFSIPKFEIPAVALGMVGTLLLSTCVLLAGHVWFAPSTLLGMIALAYPLWEWRKSISVRKLLTSELALFRREHDGLKRMARSERKSHTNTLLDQMDLLSWARREIIASQNQRQNTIELLGHDIRGPQVAIMGLLDLQAFPNKALAAQDLYNAIRFQSERSLSLLDDLMQLVNAESGSIRRDSRALADVLQEAIDQCWALSKARDVTLVQNIVATETWAKIDPALFNRALVNLINNAINFSAPGTTVTCTLWRVEEGTRSTRSPHIGPRLLLSIADQGRGIAPEHIPQLYQWRKRFHADDENAPSGFGLGLAFVKAVVDSHNGKIRCKSTVGVGSTFTISIEADTSASIWGPDILNSTYLESQMSDRGLP